MHAGGVASELSATARCLSAIRCTLHTTTHCHKNAVLFASPICNRALSFCNTLQHTATHCNTLQHTATHCNTLQHTATHPLLTVTCCNRCAVLWLHTHLQQSAVCLQHTATHCNTLQHTHCTLQHTATDVLCCGFIPICNRAPSFCNTLQHTATHYNTQHTTHRNIMQHMCRVVASCQSATERCLWNYVCVYRLPILCGHYNTLLHIDPLKQSAVSLHDLLCAYVWIQMCRDCLFYADSATHCNTPTATRCNTLQYAATRCNTLQRTATHSLQHTATHSNTLQHICLVLGHDGLDPFKCIHLRIHITFRIHMLLKGVFTQMHIWASSPLKSTIFANPYHSAFSCGC